MGITISDSGDVKSVALRGRLDTVTAPDLEKALTDMLAAGATKIVFDLAELEYVSSAGLRVFLVAAKKLKAVGGAVAVAALNSTVAEVFEISGFGSIFQIYPDGKSALEGLA